MMLAYADPPYYGYAKRYYGELHPDAHLWDDKEQHYYLLNILETGYDGWAMSCNPKDLKWLYPKCSDDVRIASWVKPYCAWRSSIRVQYTWEPVLFKPARPNEGYKYNIDSVRDHLSCSMATSKGLVGAKPDDFNDWILQLINYEPGDEVIDFFPGTDRFKHAIERADKLNRNY